MLRPRGGATLPRSCAVAATLASTPVGEPMVDHSPAGVAHIEEVYRTFAQSCLDNMGPQFLANIGTASAAQDMDAVRAALGEEQLSYLGLRHRTRHRLRAALP